jgi:hypothetical protein
MTKDEMLINVEAAKRRGDHAEIERIRQEFYNTVAAEAKKEGDLLKLNLLAAADECARAGMKGASSVMSALMMFYSLGREQFDYLCGTVLGPTCAVAAEEIMMQCERAHAQKVATRAED